MKASPSCDGALPAGPFRQCTGQADDLGRHAGGFVGREPHRLEQVAGVSSEAGRLGGGEAHAGSDLVGPARNCFQRVAGEYGADLLVEGGQFLADVEQLFADNDGQAAGRSAHDTKAFDDVCRHVADFAAEPAELVACLTDSTLELLSVAENGDVDDA
jgi:hypothetical protein